MRLTTYKPKPSRLTRILSWLHSWSWGSGFVAGVLTGLLTGLALSGFVEKVLGFILVWRGSYGG